MNTEDIPVAEVVTNIQNRLKPQSTAISKGRAILTSVADACEISLLDFTGERRTTRIANPRMLSMALCRQLTYLSHEDIATLHGRRDHSSTIHAQKRYRNSPAFLAIADAMSHAAAT
jgi:chromosomal replication initiation ATPase DnaA